jgi:hypothetical protein
LLLLLLPPPPPVLLVSLLPLPEVSALPEESPELPYVSEPLELSPPLVLPLPPDVSVGNQGPAGEGDASSGRGAEGT